MSRKFQHRLRKTLWRFGERSLFSKIPYWQQKHWSWMHWSPARITKIFPNLPHEFWLLPANERKKTKKHSNVINNFYFLVLDYLESWLNLIIVSMFVLESRQVEDVRNREPQTRWLSVNARLGTLSLNFSVYWVQIFQNVTQNLLSQNKKIQA